VVQWGGMWKKILRWLVPCLLTAGLLYGFLHDTPLAEIGRAFGRITWSAVGLYIALSLTGVWLRALRFHVLLSRRLRFVDLFLITLVYNFSVDLLPARSAALAFYDYFTKKRGVPLEKGTSSFLVAMVYDALALALLLGAAAAMMGERLPSRSILLGLLAITLASAAFIFGMRPALRLLRRWLHGWLERRPRLGAGLDSVEDYLHEHEGMSERLVLLTLSLGIRASKYVALYVLFVGVTGGAPTLSSFALVSFGVAATELSSFIPIQGLGGIGTWEAAFAFIFSQLGLALENPFLTGLVIHVVTQFWEYAIGLISFLYLALQKKGPAAA